MADTSIKISLELGAAAAQVSLGDIVDKSAQADKSIQNLGEHGSSAFAEIGLHIANASGAYEIFQGNLAANLAIKGLELLTDAAKELFALLVTEGITAASAQEDAINRLNLSLAGAGEYTGEASKDVQEFAEKLSNSTTISKTAILQNAALLESFGRLSGEGLKDATKASVELSAVLGIDLETATRLVGKAAEGNITSFKRYGLEVEKGSTNSETFANALEAIAARGEAAEGRINTYSGALKQNANALEELQVSVGANVVQNAAFVSAIQAATENFRRLTDQANEAGPGLKIVFAEILIGALQIAETTAAAFDGIARTLYATFEGVKTVVLFAVEVVATSTLGLFAKVSPAISEFLSTIQNEVRDSASKTAGAFTGETGLGAIVSAFGDMKAAAQGALTAIENGTDKTTAPINGAKKAAEELTVELTRQQLAAQKLAETLLTQANTSQAQYSQQLKDLENGLKQQEDAIKISVKNREVTSAAGLAKEKAAEQQNFKDRFALLDENNATEAAQLKSAFDSDLIDEDEYYTARLQLSKNYSAEYQKTLAAQAAADKALNDQETALNAEKIKAVGDTFTALGSLMRTKNRELFEIGKQASAAAALINTYEAITKTMAAVPYPFNIPLAIAQGIAGAVEVANIESTQPAFANGGVVGGSSFSGDNVTARVNSGEMVLTGNQQANLFALANGQAGGSGANALAGQVAQLGAAVAQLASQPIVVSIDGAAVFNATRNQIRSGRTLA